MAALLLVLAPVPSPAQLFLTLPDSIRGLSHDDIEAWKADARGRIIRDRRDPMPRLELGYLYLEQGAAAMARTYFAETLRFDRGSAAAEVGFFRIARAEGREDEARKHLERAAIMSPDLAAEIRGLADAPPRQPTDGSYPKLMDRLQKTRLLALDDFGLAPLDDSERRDLLEVLEDRGGRQATLLTSQLPLELWHEAIGDATLADAILDRLVHHAHRINLKGGSMRRQKPNQTSSESTAA